jgi:lysophospholipase L1-like esterase
MRPHLLVLIVTTGFVTCFARASPSDVAVSRLSDEAWRQRFMEKQAELHRHPVDLVFLGDSILHSLEWDKRTPVWDHWYAGRHAINLGFNSDMTGNVIWRVQNGELDGISPKLVVILIGANDVWRPPGEIADQIMTLTQSVKERVPGARVLVLSILPSGRPQRDQQTARQANAMLAARLAAPGAIAHYVDVSCVFLHHDRLNTALFREAMVPGHSYPLHPTARGMDLLAAKIEPVVSKILGDPPRSTPGYPEETDCSPGH